MKQDVQALFELTQTRYPALKECAPAIQATYEAIVESVKQGGKVLVCGNGRSCADSEHIVGELMKGFLRKRPICPKLAEAIQAADSAAAERIIPRLQSPVTAIALNSHPGLSSAIANDLDASMIYAQQLLGLGRKGDVFIGLSTSGNAANVYNAAVIAKALGITVVGMTGVSGGKLAGIADILISVSEKETYMVQELHLPVYHCLCAMVEAEIFGGAA
jgi:D-sedoheptulose 7-phosphate isomerase